MSEIEEKLLRWLRLGRLVDDMVAGEKKADLPSAATQDKGTTRKCPHCHKDKDFSEFSINRRRPDGLQSWCKTCMNESKRDSRRRNRALALAASPLENSAPIRLGVLEITSKGDDAEWEATHPSETRLRELRAAGRERYIGNPIKGIPPSPEWDRKRKLKYKEAGGICEMNRNHQGRRINAHHNTYVNLYHERRSDIIVLCDECHALYHGKLPSPPKE